MQQLQLSRSLALLRLLLVTRLRELVGVQERFLEAVNEFPAIKSRNEDGTFVFEAWEDKPEQAPIWYRGEEVCLLTTKLFAFS